MARRVVTIFGGSGFIGRNLVKRLAEQGDLIRIAVRDPERALFLKPAGDVGQIVTWATDITKPDQVATAVAGADLVINTVGILYESGRSTFQSIHVDGAKTIALAAKQAGARQLIHISALGADASSDSAYAKSKADGEQAVLAAFPEATIFRPSVIFGPDDGFLNKFASIARLVPILPVIGAPLIPKISLLQGDSLIDIDLFGEGGPKFQMVYVGDVVNAISAALKQRDSAGKTYQLGGPTVYSFKQIMELLREQTAIKCWLVPWSYGLASFQAWFLEKLPKPVITRDQIILMKTDNVVADKASGFADLGIQPRSAEAMLPTYIHRFRPPVRQRQLGLGNG